MEKDISLGSETDLKIGYIDGKIEIVIVYDGKGVDGELKAKADLIYFLEKLADAIPGEIDNKIINGLKGLLGK